MMVTAGQSRQSPPAERWLWRLRALSRPRCRLFCMPYAGGTAATFREWSACLPGDIEVIALQYPGRASRLHEPPLTQLRLFIKAICDAVAPLADRPFAFFGHSMGATLAYEVARALRDQGARQPEFLFLSGQSAPHLPRVRPKLHALRDDQLVLALRALNGTQDELLCQPELLEIFLPALRADLEAVETWEHVAGAPLNMPLHIFGGSDDPEVPVERLRGWAEHSTAPCRLLVLPGDHFFINAHIGHITKIIAHSEWPRPPNPGQSGE